MVQGDERTRFVGQRLRRKEDPRFLTGRGRYVDDVKVPGLLHAAFVRSPYAHAEIEHVDVAEALDVPGVVHVLTAADLEGVVQPLRALSTAPGYKECDTPILAADRVRMAGDPVAIVIAESRYQAEDGADATLVSYTPLPVITNMDDAVADGAIAIHEAVDDNVYSAFEDSHGDVDGAFAAADVVLELEFESQRCGPVPLEARAVLADFDQSSGRLTVWVSHQGPHLFRTGISRCLAMPESQIRVISPDVGGGFGSKLIVYQEDVATVAASKILGRPVKWAADRREDLMTTMQGREQRHRIELAATSQGRVLGVRADIAADNGAYAVWPLTAGLDSGQASENITGPYDIPNYARRVRAIATNKTPMGPYRGVGRPMACFSMERSLDELARRLNMDPLEVRAKNVVRTFPYETPVGLRLESGSYAESIELLKEALDYDRLTDEIKRERAQGRYRGIGAALIVEHTALGCQEVSKKGIDLNLGYDTATVRIEPDGNVTVAVGLHSHGQGQETTMSQIAADSLGVAPDNIRVVFGDTDVVPYGMGTWASRSTVFCGGATILAARDVIEKMRAIAASMLEADVDDIEAKNGVFSIKGAPETSVAFNDIAKRALHEAHLLPDDIDPGLEATRKYSGPDPGSFSSALHAALVEVNTTTGAIDIQRYVVIEDCGNMVNPLIIEGQVHGGVAQGLGHAMMEELRHDEMGQLVTSTFMDYVIPGFMEVPEIEVLHIETPSPYTVGGFKGMGESGAINPPAVIANAVSDALSPFGVSIRRTPVTSESVLKALWASDSWTQPRTSENGEVGR